MTRRVRTRIAPSPTGFLHLGTARTALFSWAFARHHGGDFILRIEDTDVARSTQEAVDQIIAAMNWLRLDYDEGPFYQMKRLDRYKAVVEQMLEAGSAYRCYCSPEELEAMREAQRARREAALRRPLAARAGQDPAGNSRGRAAGGALSQSAGRRGDLERHGQGPDHDR